MSELKVYEVALPMQVAAADEFEAIDAFIQQVVNHGLAPWHFSVRDINDEKAKAVHLNERPEDEDEEAGDDAGDEPAPDSTDEESPTGTQ